MKTIKQFSESKATEKGERDVGSKAYTDYVTDLTPGAVSNTDAKKSDRETKKTNALKIHRATRLDDAIDPEIEQANAQYEREKDELRKQHIKNVANIRSNKIGEEVEDEFDYKAKKGAIAAPGSGSIAKAQKPKATDVNKSIEQQMAAARKEDWVELDPSDVLIEYDQEEVEMEAKEGKPHFMSPSLPSPDQQITDPKQLAALHRLKQKRLGKDYDKPKKEEVEMGEKNWIKGAIKHPGALRKSLDVPAGENIPARKLASAAKEGGKMGQRARLAQTLKKMHNEFVPENGDHPPKKAHKHDKKKDKPEQGKVYALTGKSSDASIARGDSWKDSEVKK